MSERNDLDAARRLRRAVEELPFELQPTRDLWPEIAGRLHEPREAPGGGWWRLAAAVVMMAAGLAAAVLLRPEAPAAGTRLALTEPAAEMAMAAPHMRQRDGVLHAHNDLVAVVSRQMGRLDETAVGTLTTAMADLERATAEIEAALAQNPGNRNLRLALAASYRREAGWTSRLNQV